MSLLLSLRSTLNNAAPFVETLTQSSKPTDPVGKFTLFRRTVPPLEHAPADAVGNGWRLLNEHAATGAIVDAINGAKQVVNVEFFSLVDSGKGAHVTDALVNAAARGVEVNVLVDATAAISPPLGSYHRMERRVEQAGGTVISNIKSRAFANQVGLPALRHVNHRKVVTVDGKTAFTGGINYLPVEDKFRDSMVELSGPAAARLSANQLDRWGRVGGAVSARHQTAVQQAMQGVDDLPKNRSDLHIRVNAPEQSRFDISDDYLELIRSTKNRLWISSPAYTDRLLMQEIQAAVERGVDVRLLTGDSAPGGVVPINWLNNSNIKQVLKLGGRAFSDKGVLHRKTLVADDEVVFGSFNVTGRSRLHDHEIAVRTADKDFVNAVSEILAREMDNGRELGERDMNRWSVRFAELLTQKLKFSY